MCRWFPGSFIAAGKGGGKGAGDVPDEPEEGVSNVWHRALAIPAPQDDRSSESSAHCMFSCVACNVYSPQPAACPHARQRGAYFRRIAVL